MTRFWIWLIAGTVFLMVFSWVVSIREKRFHGYPRFFAFESVFLLVLLNAHPWFRDPLSPRQILSWLFLLASIMVAAAGVLALKKYGQPRGPNFENTTRLVDQGIYRRIRHPMYASIMFFGIGAFLKGITPVTLVILTVNLAACVLTAVMEEREMKATFGPAYVSYMETTKRFIPFVY